MKIIPNSFVSRGRLSSSRGSYNSVVNCSSWRPVFLHYAVMSTDITSGNNNKHGCRVLIFVGLRLQLWG